MSDTTDKAFESICRMVAIREHSCDELSLKLRKKGFAQADIEDALSKALSCGLIDNNRYARSYAYTMLSSGHGVMGIRSHLESIGLNQADVECVISETLDDLFPDHVDEIDRALNLLERSYFSSSNPRDAAFRKLVRKGYTFEQAKCAATRFFPDKFFDN